MLLPVTLHLPERLTQAEADGCLRGLAQILAAGQGPVLADASRLAEFDSAALAVLLSLRRDAQAGGREFSVQGLSPRLRELAAVYGVEALLPG